VIVARMNFRKDRVRCFPILPSRELAETRAFDIGRLTFRSDRRANGCHIRSSRAMPRIPPRRTFPSTANVL